MAQVAAYAFDEGTGATAAEVGGGTAITGVPGWAAGRQGSAMFLNLVNGPTISPYAVSTVFTAMFDVYVVGDGGAGYNIFLSNTAGVGNIQADSNGALEWYHDTGVTSTTTVMTDATWYNIAIVADGTNHIVYVNGTSVGSSANTALSSTGSIKIGGDLGGGYTANFRMDNLRFFNTALSQSEISSLSGTAAAVIANSNTINLNDNVGITDVLTATSDAPATLTVNLADAVGITDTSSPQTLSYDYSIADPVGITDVLTATATVPGGSATLADPVGITDAIDVTASYALTLADAVGITDAIVVTKVTMTGLWYSDGTTWTRIS